MVSSLELRRIAAFSSLPDDQISWFLSHVQEVPVRAGEAFVRQGEPADWMVIFLEGLFNGEESSAAILCHFQRKLVTLVGCFLSPG